MTQPVTTIRKLWNEGTVITTDNSCKTTANELTTILWEPPGTIEWCATYRIVPEACSCQLIREQMRNSNLVPVPKLHAATRHFTPSRGQSPQTQTLGQPRQLFPKNASGQIKWEISRAREPSSARLLMAENGGPIVSRPRTGTGNLWPAEPPARSASSSWLSASATGAKLPPKCSAGIGDSPGGPCTTFSLKQGEPSRPRLSASCCQVVSTSPGDESSTTQNSLSAPI